ncbi:IclR family transcriptional regulator [Achromobacter deleyi]|uniref:IclR family transcriptional regulator n=1 Tax=Achromobacter deleyi TaxID=1353891 RepID=UPI0014928A85|nr:IclR family transcriptional regulator [Achromobacter deleyi]QVQ27112.1 IclR family transcriptional regulator [Achromobacter deleyi]UIP22700.1 IclR family transcriptional regulator [Achromobacter deleyi]
MSDVVRSAARVLDLLEFFSASRSSYTLGEIAGRFSLPKSSALGLLRTLCSRGYVVRDEQGQYTLNAYFRQHGFGWGGDTLARLVAIAAPMMAEMAAELGETVSLGSLQDSGHLKILEQALSHQPIRYETTPGQLFPVYCTAIGRVLLAHSTPQRRDEMLARHPREAITPYTLTALADIHAKIAQAAQDGYSVVEEEAERGGTGLAMAILDKDGQPLAALNVAFISARFADKREQAVQALRQRVAVIQAALGEG